MTAYEAADQNKIVFFLVTPMRGSPNWHNKHITRSEFHSTNASFLSEWAELFTLIATRKQVANVERAENKPETNFSCSASAKRFKPKTIWIHFPNIKVCSKPTKYAETSDFRAPHRRVHNAQW